MNTANSVEVSDWNKANRLKDKVRIGHYFVFVENADFLAQGRLSRLLPSQPQRTRIFPLVQDPVALPGVTIHPKTRNLDPLACVVSDRKLYKAEQDTVYLYIAAPSKPQTAQLVVRYNDAPFTERALSLSEGITLESLSMLLAGEYSAQLTIDNKEIGEAIHFTVAEYQLAPLSARLLSQRLTQGQLYFELQVESYQLPCSEELFITLQEGECERAKITQKGNAEGIFQGHFPLSGDGPFHLRLQATKEASRVAEVALAGSQAQQRALTIVNELGQAMHFSMMPEAQSIPLRGGYLGQGEALETPLTVENVVTEALVLRVHTQLDELSLICLDLANGEVIAQALGSFQAGDNIPIPSQTGPVSIIWVGCWVQGHPFEGFSSRWQPAHLALQLQTPATLRPKENLHIRLQHNQPGSLPVLLCVRDQRLLAERPDVALGSALKRSIDQATAGMEEGFSLLADQLPQAESLLLGEIDPLAEMAYFDCDSQAPLAVAAAMPEAMAIMPAPVQASRADFPESLLYALVTVAGDTEITLPVGDALTTLSVEAFILADGDWHFQQQSVCVDQPVRLDLEMPTAVHPGDEVYGQLRAVCPSQRAQLALYRDEQRVSLRLPGQQQWLSGDALATPIVLEFPVQAGQYRAELRDLETGEEDRIERVVTIPGQFRYYAKHLTLLQAGESLHLDQAQALSLRILPALRERIEGLSVVTASYAHLCCEQTAAKILAAVFWYLNNTEITPRKKASEIILAGIARERSLLRTGKGFAFYPHTAVNDYYSGLTVRYLWHLEKLSTLPALSATLQNALQEGITLADDAAQAHGIVRVPKHIATMHDAYCNAKQNSAAAQRFVAQHVHFQGAQATPRHPSHAVADRALLAYAAATLAATNDLSRAILLANVVGQHFNAAGGCYSTLDSAAAIVMLAELQKYSISTGQINLQVNGQTCSITEALALADPVKSILVQEGIALVEIIRLREEDWGRYQQGFPIKVKLKSPQKITKPHFRQGESVVLQVSLPQGYEAGDLLHVQLPACLSWLRGGGRVQTFSLDFAGKDTLSVPLVVTGALQGKQHFAVCVRNMFQEERASSPGLLTVAAGWW